MRYVYDRNHEIQWYTYQNNQQIHQSDRSTDLHFSSLPLLPSQELLCFIPSPTRALLLLFPINNHTEQRRDNYRVSLTDQDRSPHNNKPYYMHQTIGNACGTIALLHALGNNQDILTLNPHSFLAQFFTNTQIMNPEQRGKYLESPPPGAPTIDSLHEEFASLGQTSAPDADTGVNLHFACFVQLNGKLWELDGRYAGPINHGECSSGGGNLLRDAVKVVKRDFMDQADGDINFTLIAFAPKQEDN